MKNIIPLQDEVVDVTVKSGGEVGSIDDFDPPKTNSAFRHTSVQCMLF